MNDSHDNTMKEQIIEAFRDFAILAFSDGIVYAQTHKSFRLDLEEMLQCFGEKYFAILGYERTTTNGDGIVHSNDTVDELLRLTVYGYLSYQLLADESLIEQVIGSIMKRFVQEVSN